MPYTANQMFELVNDTESYPRFLPWCHSSTILTETDREVVATIEIAWKGIRKSFTTKNILTPYTSIDIELVNGPLKHLEGIWRFQELNQHACKVVLELEFAFTGGLIDHFFQPVFQHIANTLVDSFVKRAAEVYGAK